MRTIAVQSESPTRLWLRNILAEAQTLPAEQRSLCVVRVTNVSQRTVDDVGGVLQAFTQVACGPLISTQSDSSDFTVLVAGWPQRRAGQIARLTRAIIQRDNARQDSKIRIAQIPILPEDVDAEALNATIKHFCNNDVNPRPNLGPIEIVSVKLSPSTTERNTS